MSTISKLIWMVSLYIETNVCVHKRYIHIYITQYALVNMGTKILVIVLYVKQFWIVFNNPRYNCLASEYQLVEKQQLK